MSLHHLIVSWFAWPDGGVWSNLAASLLWSGLVWLPSVRRLHRKVEAQHNELMAEHRALRARDRHAAGGSDD